MTTIGIIGAMQIEIDKLIEKYNLVKDKINKDIYVNEFNEYKVNSLINNIPYNRSNSLKLFMNAGFIDMKKDYYMKKFDTNERIIMVELTKEKYNEIK